MRRTTRNVRSLITVDVNMGMMREGRLEPQVKSVESEVRHSELGRLYIPGTTYVLLQ